MLNLKIKKLFTTNQRTCVFLFFLTLLFIFLNLYAASALRGDDQYWYVADMEQLVQGGPYITNNVYPTQILSPGSFEPQPFIHNILNIYFAVPASMLLGAFHGWVATNIIASIVTSVLIGLIVYKISGKWPAVIAYSIYLFLPLTIRQTSQPQAEATIAPLVVFFIWLYIRAESKKMWFFLALNACALYYCRLTFLPILLVLPFWYLFNQEQLKPGNYIFAAGLLVFAVVAIYLKKIIFVQGLNVPLWAIFNNAVPGKTDNMAVFYQVAPKPVLLENLWLKLKAGLIYQFFPKSWKWQIFHLPFNLLVVSSVSLCFLKKSKPIRRLIHCSVFFLLIHILTVTIAENQFRYMLTAMPVFVTGGIVFLHQFLSFLHRDIKFALTLIFMLMIFVVDLFLAQSLHMNGLKESRIRAHIKPVFETTIPDDDVVMVEGIGKYQLLGYVLRPRLVVFIKEGYTKEQYKTIKNKSDAEWLICPKSSSVKDYYETRTTHDIANLPEPFKDYQIYRFE